MANLEAKVACLLMTLMVGAGHATTCGSVVSSLAPCLDYFKTGGAPPPVCCDGVKSVNDAASTPPDRQAVCVCIKALVLDIGVNPVLLNSIGAKCGLNITYTYSPSIDCSKVN